MRIKFLRNAEISKMKKNCEEEIKTITLLSAASWIFSIIFLMAGAGALLDAQFGGLGAGIPLLLLGVVLFPLTHKFLKNKFKLELSKYLIAAIVIILMIISAAAVNRPTTTETKEVRTSPPIYDENSHHATEIPAPIKNVKSATINIDRVQVVVANLYPMRITVKNTGTISFDPQFDVKVYDSSENKVCDSSPMLDAFETLQPNEQKTNEIQIMGCMLKKDGTYTLDVDVLDEDYNKLASARKTFDVNYWGQFGIGNGLEDYKKILDKYS